MNLLRALRDEARGIARALVIGWPSTPLGFVMRQRYWRHHAKVRRIVAARGARVSGWEYIRFGEDCQFGEHMELVADGACGLHVYLGSHILFARGVYVRSSNHVISDRSRHILDQGHESKRVVFEGHEYAVVIEDECWIGANVVIVSGAHIGRGAVIAAGAVVAGVIPPYSIAGGVPARVISERK